MNKKKNTEFVDLVKSDSRVDAEDPRLFLSSKLEVYLEKLKKNTKPVAD